LSFLKDFKPTETNVNRQNDRKGRCQCFISAPGRYIKRKNTSVHVGGWNMVNFLLYGFGNKQPAIFSRKPEECQSRNPFAENFLRKMERWSEK
jgi:hypothetical protein